MPAADRSYSALIVGRPDQSALAPVALTTLAHFSVSPAMNSPKSAGEPDDAVPPKSAKRDLILGSARIALISLLSFSTISATGIGCRFELADPGEIRPDAMAARESPRIAKLYDRTGDEITLDAI
jgi:hypothetical protein